MNKIKKSSPQHICLKRVLGMMCLLFRLLEKTRIYWTISGKLLPKAKSINGLRTD